MCTSMINVIVAKQKYVKLVNNRGTIARSVVLNLRVNHVGWGPRLVGYSSV